MASHPPPPYTPPPGWDPRTQRDAARQQARVYRDQARRMRYAARGGRRTSILGPLLLIAVGVVFLMIQLGWVNRQTVSEIYGRWWPALFLASGLILLAEWAWDQHRQREGDAPQYRRSIGGGAFLLLLLLGLAGFVSNEFWRHVAGNGFYRSLHMNPDDLDHFFGDKHESEQKLDLPLIRGAALQLSNPRGDVTVSGTSDDGLVHIAIHKQVYTRTDSEAETKFQALKPVVTSSAALTTISVPPVGGGSADLTVIMPANAALTLVANHGDVEAASLQAAVDLTANHGDVEISAITAPVTVHINSGGASLTAHSLAAALTIEGHAQDLTLSDIAGPVSVNGEFFGTTHLEHIGRAIHFRTSRTELQLARLDGEIEISPHSDLSADQALGPFILSTSNRDIDLTRIAGDISVTNRNGSIELTAAPSLGAINLADRNGSVRATLPTGAPFTVEATATDGDISTALPLASHDTGSHKQLTGSIGSGGPLVRIVTSHGDINLSQATVEPLAPTPPPTPKLTITPVPASPARGAGPSHPARQPRPAAAPPQTAGSATF
jgi:DUF4097 and DUF4098 domain-containing protein YvlB